MVILKRCVSIKSSRLPVLCRLLALLGPMSLLIIWLIDSSQTQLRLVPIRESTKSDSKKAATEERIQPSDSSETHALCDHAVDLDC